jgi:hypothetical protein
MEDKEKWYREKEEEWSLREISIKNENLLYIKKIY